MLSVLYGLNDIWWYLFIYVGKFYECVGWKINFEICVVCMNIKYVVCVIVGGKNELIC